MFVTADRRDTLVFEGQWIEAGWQTDRGTMWRTTYQGRGRSPVRLFDHQTNDSQPALLVEQGDSVLLFRRGHAELGGPTWQILSTDLVAFRFAYPVVADSVGWQWSAREANLPLDDIARLYNDLSPPEWNHTPLVTLVSVDLRTRRLVLQCQWPTAVREVVLSFPSWDRASLLSVRLLGDSTRP